MKRLLSVLLLTCCMAFAFTACSNSKDTHIDTYFNFDENSTVKFTYVCNDAEKNFDAELNEEKAQSFVLSLNEISYSEIIDVDFNRAPSYDSLMIKINNESLNLHDLAYSIRYGGYFYFNGGLCKTEEKFSFLEPYLAEYRPDIIPESIPFKVQYVQSDSCAEDKESYRIIKSVSQLNYYIEAETQDLNLSDIAAINEAVTKYTVEYFENSFIIIFMEPLGSSAYDLKVNEVCINKDRLLIYYKTSLPDANGENFGIPADMAYRYTFVELSNEYDTVQNAVLISSN